MSDSTITSASTSSSGTIRLAGMYSSTDVDGMVKAMLTNENKRIENQQKEIQKQEWTNDAYEAINTKVAEFVDTYLTTSGSGSMLMLSSLMARQVQNSNTSAVSITASGSVETESLVIESMKKATAAQVNSEKIFNNEETKTATKMTIDDFAAKLGITASGTKEVTETVTKKDADGNVVKDDDGKEVTEEVTKTVNVYKFNLNGKEISVEGDKTISDLVSKVNSEDTSVKMSFNVFTGSFDIANKSTGENATLTVGAEGADNSNDLLAAIFSYGKDAGTIASEIGTALAGTNAQIKFEGNDEVFEYESNQFSLGGYSFNILNDSDEKTTVSSSVNTDAMVERIEKFVNAYNELQKTLYSYAYTKPDRDYEPLSEDDKKKMSDDQIEDWEKKAKQGVLYGDKNIKNLMKDLRSLFTSTTSELGTKFYSIGIKTAAYSSGSKDWGKVEIDKNKLKSALASNAEDIATMFTSRTTANGATQGIAVKFNEITGKYQNNYKFKVSPRMTDKLTALKELLEKLKDKLADKEDRLYEKFSAMESSMSAMTSQASFLFS